MQAFLLRLLATFNNKIKPFINLIIPILTGALAEFLGAMTPVAVNAVLAAANSTASNAEKRDQVFDTLQTEAIKAGFVVGASAINQLLETTVASLKAQGQIQ